jgi:hypothetical protein
MNTSRESSRVAEALPNSRWKFLNIGYVPLLPLIADQHFKNDFFIFKQFKYYIQMMRKKTNFTQGFL